MASTREIRRRIKSIKNTAQITKAMQLVAASKMRRAQAQVLAGRPYNELMNELLGSLSGKIDRSLHPLLATKVEEKNRKIGIILIGPSRGLAGGLMSNLIRSTVNFIEKNELAAGKKIKTQYKEAYELKEEIEVEGLVNEVESTSFGVITVERKARDFILKLGHKLIGDFQKLNSPPTMFDTNPIAKIAMESFLDGTFTDVYLVYPHFVNTMTQKVVIKKILPIEESSLRVKEESEDVIVSEYTFEPKPNELLKALLPHFVEMEVYQAVLEAAASEHSARMVAMKSATDNAEEIIDDLTLTYNQVRQAAITQELLEITSAAAALE
ncbi:MAG: F0F1 ATP synthase subunit gamma [Patescibacteria group bacterium]|nr:F0F1 ATP synthase subunit gamma [Patescibacteria group bacterium]